MEFFINPLTFKHSLTKWRLFLHALKISPLFPPREIRLPRSIEFHSRNGRNSGYSNERIHRRPTYDSIRFSQGGKKKINFHRNLRRIFRESSKKSFSFLFPFMKQYFNVY